MSNLLGLKELHDQTTMKYLPLTSNDIGNFLSIIGVLVRLREQGGAFSLTVGRGTTFLEDKPAVLAKEALGVTTDEPLMSVTSHSE